MPTIPATPRRAHRLIHLFPKSARRGPILRDQVPIIRSLARHFLEDPSTLPGSEYRVRRGMVVSLA